MLQKRKLYRTSIILLGASLLSCGILLSHSASSYEVTAAAASAPATVKASDKGKEVYEMNCLSCHAVDGKGFGKYPAVVSDHTQKKLGTYDKAYEFISRNMPQNSPGSLREEDYQAVTAYIIALNGIPVDFSDIGGHWAQKEISDLFDKKFIDGYTDKQEGVMRFKPDQNITRAEFIRYFVKAKELFLSNSTQSEFTDLSSNKQDRVYIITAVEYGLINGYPDHTFRPKSNITRAEIAAILSRSEMLKPTSETDFKDIAAGYWAGDAIRAVQQAHLFNGYEDGTFRPDNKMTRAEAVAVIYRLIQ